MLGCGLTSLYCSRVCVRSKWTHKDETQMSMGNHFLHDHPAAAVSRKTPSGRQDPEVNVQQCIFGCTLPADKPTRFMSSIWALLEHISHRCSRDNGHRTAVKKGQVTAAAEYPAKLSNAILCGIDAQHLREIGDRPRPAVTSPRNWSA